MYHKNTPDGTLSSIQKECFVLRSKILFAMERFFQQKDYISVHSPILSSWLIPEQHIDVLSLGEGETHKAQTKEYLLPSPELYLKQLLTLFGDNPPHIYEFSHSFRNKEPQDAIHNREFLMLEWYTIHASLQDSIQISNELISEIAQVLQPYNRIPKWATQIPLCISLKELYHTHTGINLDTLIECETIKDTIAYITQYNLSLPLHVSHYEWEDIFNFILVEYILPQIPIDRPVYLTHYPSRIDTLASPDISTYSKKLQSYSYSNRWELYIQGIEIANCYVEETNPARIQQFALSQQEKIAANNSERTLCIPYNTNYLNVHHLPLCSGVAMGVDRFVLCMLDDFLNTQASLKDVSPLSLFQGG